MRLAWEYSESDLEVLCGICHSKIHFTEEDEREFEFTEEVEEAAKEDYERELRFIEEQVERETKEEFEREFNRLQRENESGKGIE